MNGAVCKKSDMDFWIDQKIYQYIGEKPTWHRKYWEIGFILYNLKILNLIQKNKKGLVFGCGIDPIIPALASQEVYVTATDQPLSTGLNSDWNLTNQYCSGLESFKIYDPKITTWDIIKSQIEFKEIDMNNIKLPAYNYDFLWSSCSLEHLGSIENSINFILKSTETLKPGGYAIHTTEYDWHDNRQVDDPKNCIFNKNSFVTMSKKIKQLGHHLYPIDFSIGEQAEDRHIDAYPFELKTHLKLKVGIQHLTSIGFIIKTNRIKL